MKEKTIKEIAAMPRVKEAFLDHFQGVDGDKQKPVQFVADRIVEYIKSIVENYEIRKAKEHAEIEYNKSKTALDL